MYSAFYTDVKGIIISIQTIQNIYVYNIILELMSLPVT